MSLPPWKPPKQIFQEFEKYYEFLTYSYKDIADKLDVKLGVILDFMVDNGLKLVSFDNWLDYHHKSVDHIHKLIRINGVMPREYHTTEKLGQIYKQKDAITFRDVLDTLFVDNTFKEREIENLAFLLLLRLLYNVSHLDEVISQWNSLQYIDVPPYSEILRKYGIEPDPETWEMEETLTGKVALEASGLWGILLEMAMGMWVQWELIRIKKFIKKFGISSSVWRIALDQTKSIIKESIFKLSPIVTFSNLMVQI